MIPGNHMADARTHGLDHPRALMPQHHRHRKRNGPVDHRQIAVAQPRGPDPDQHLTRPRIPHLQIVHDPWPLTVEYDASHHRSSLGRPSTRSAMMLRWISSEPP